MVHVICVMCIDRTAVTGSENCMLELQGGVGVRDKGREICGEVGEIQSTDRLG